MALPEKISVEDLFASPTHAGAVISPDGTWIAYLAPWENRMNIWIAVHDDLIDGVEWAVAHGYADPERVAIFGGSYGGYAALVGATFTPDVFAAAVDHVGISDLSNFMRTLPEVARPHMANSWFRFVSDPDVPSELEDMMARSPISRVGDPHPPLLITQGANDSRVVKAESDNLVQALRRRGAQVQYVVKDDEGHGFVNPDNKIDMFQTVEAFLAQHLGGRC